MPQPSPVKPAPVRLQLLDTFRFAAAAAVVVYHWLFGAIEIGFMTTVTYSGAAEFASYGYLGVHLFFMISGFVIAASAQGRTASRFAVSRLVRLYPAFWAAVLITAMVTLVWGGSTFSVTLPQVLANLTMVPDLFDQPMVDRVYWTLFNELLFYGMVFVFLLAGKGRWLDAFFPAWALGMVAVAMVAPHLSEKPFMGTLFGFFAAGAIISTIQRRGWHWWQVVGLAATLYVVLSYMVDDVAKLNADGGPFTLSLPVTLAIVCSFYVLLLVQIIPRVSAWVIPQSRLMGALTYPLYLLHAYVGYIFFNHVANDENKWIINSVAFGLVLLLAYAVHVVVERWPRKMWFRFFDTVAGVPLRWVESRTAGKRPEPSRELPREPEPTRVCAQ